MRQHIKRAYTTSTTTTTTMLTVTTRDGLIEFHYMSPMYKTLFTKFTQFSIFPNFLWMWIFCCCCFYCKHWTKACPCSLPCHSFIVHVHRLTFSLILSVAKEKWICAFRWHQLHVVRKGETDQLRHAEHARMRKYVAFRQCIDGETSVSIKFTYTFSKMKIKTHKLR